MEDPSDLTASCTCPPPYLCTRWGLNDPHLLGQRVNTHWRVTSRHGPVVLRRYGPDVTKSDINYELRLAEQLATAGWPVPPLMEPPFPWQDRWWAVFGLLPGLHKEKGPDGDRQRGRLLAEIHTSIDTFPATQRPGWTTIREVVLDPQLGHALGFIEHHFPEHGRILLWHLDRAAQRFADVAEPLPTTVIHGDFNSRNLLFVGTRLSGILDFEASHLDHRIADFALSWRAKRDEVVLGYDEVARLTDAEWDLLTPCFWGWAFLGVAAEVERMKRGEIAPHGFDWPVSHLLRRSPLMGADAIPYP